MLVLTWPHLFLCMCQAKNAKTVLGQILGHGLGHVWPCTVSCGYIIISLATLGMPASVCVYIYIHTHTPGKTCPAGSFPIYLQNCLNCLLYYIGIYYIIYYYFIYYNSGMG